MAAGGSLDRNPEHGGILIGVPATAAIILLLIGHTAEGPEIHLDELSAEPPVP